MRVTNKMLSNNFLRDMKNNLENLKNIDEQMTSGKEVRRPSDNPFKVARSMQLHTEINTNKQYNENIKDTISWLDTTDTALAQGGEVLHRIRELLVSAGNGAYSENERKAIKDEINEKIGEFSQVMNTNFDGKYIFGGTRGTTKPMDVTGGSSFAGAAETNALNFSGMKSLVGTDGKLIKDIEIKLTVGTTPTKTVDIKVTGAITKLDDLAKKINAQINVDPNFKDKIEVVPDIVNNKLEFRNKSTEKVEIGAITDLGISAGAISGNKSLSSSALNLSGVDSLTTNGNLNKELKITIGTQNISINGSISSLSDLASKVNEQISTNPGLKDKIKVVSDIANNQLKFVNIGGDIKNEFTISSTELGIAIGKDKATFNPNNVSNTRLMYYKKGGGELDVGNEYNQIAQKLKVEISQGVTVDYNITANEVIQFDGKDMRNIFNNIVNHLDGKNDDGSAADPDAVKILVGKDLQDITDAMDNMLKLRAQAGAKQNSMESAKDKNVDQNFNMTQILSKTEDIDITEKTMEMATAQTVYIAALQASARIIQPSLMDYIR